MSLRKLFVIVLTVVNLSHGCKLLYACLEDQCVPYWPLDICVTAKRNDLYVSSLLSCDHNDDLIMYDWGLNNNSNCDGDFSDSTPFPVELIRGTYECDGDECKYALVRRYLSESCTNTGDYYDTPFAVDMCEEVNGFYGSITCDESALIYKLYEYSDCTGPLIDFRNIYEDGDCSSAGEYIDIVYCSATETEFYEIMDIIFNIILISLCLSGLIIVLWIVYKLWINLYEWQSVEVCRIQNCITIGFSDKHEWLGVEPSKQNKIYALVSTLLYAVYFASWFIMYSVYLFIHLDMVPQITFTEWQCIWWIFTLVSMIGELLYIYYLTSTLEYHMNVDPVMEANISVKYLKFIKNGMIVIIIIEIGRFIVYVSDPEIFEFEYLPLIDVIFVCLRKIILRLFLLYFYYSGFNHLCHYWYAREWEEYDQFGENEPTHQIHLNVARVLVSVVASLFATVLGSLVCIIYYSYNNGHHHINYQIEMVEYCIYVLIVNIENVIFPLSIYFIYPFSHIHYEKICGRCHITMVNHLKKNHQKQVQRGGFNPEGNQYQEGNGL